MFARLVMIDGERSVLVYCVPDTPMSEVLRRASEQMKVKEREEMFTRRHAHV